jgi:hypothetical protein
MTGACGPYNLGGSATDGIRAHTMDQLQHYATKMKTHKYNALGSLNLTLD